MSPISATKNYNTLIPTSSYNFSTTVSTFAVPSSPSWRLRTATQLLALTRIYHSFRHENLSTKTRNGAGFGLESQTYLSDGWQPGKNTELLCVLSRLHVYEDINDLLPALEQFLLDSV